MTNQQPPGDDIKPPKMKSSAAPRDVASARDVGRRSRTASADAFRLQLHAVLDEARRLINEPDGFAKAEVEDQMLRFQAISVELLARMDGDQCAHRPGDPDRSPTPATATRADAPKGFKSAAPRPPKRKTPASLLVIEDNKDDRDLLARLLEGEGYEVTLAEDGEHGLFVAQTKRIDLVLLDVSLPGMNGIEILDQLKADIALRKVPVIMLSGFDQEKNIVCCIEKGAEDYLSKSFNPVLLHARIEACLERKRLADLEETYLAQLQAEQQKSERLLLNILPRLIADRLKGGESTIAESFPEVTVLFADVVGFTLLSAKIGPADLVHFLNQIFSAFDRLAEQHGLEKIKTIGDAYMMVGGLPTPRPDHSEAVAEMALDMLTEIAKFNTRNHTSLSIRIGINTGPVVAGIIGEKKFIYDLWGDTVNTASRMESHSQPGCIQTTAATYERLRGKYRFESRGPIQVKGKGEMATYLLKGRFLPKTAPQPIFSAWVSPETNPKPPAT